ncbi:DUF2971 domain-containing protein [Larkinella humicola]|uniref:DUF2971 domain-containing protein n=1 Tax=Larkinella humicola TaxID=2607654 RepID=A0A5N1J3N7_9BACT|nr:DUF2971 domain-containing protein [Larkinella humicola]KAA9341146.1 DUF2971 domain-containing protein [Larkinella humicola]
MESKERISSQNLEKVAELIPTILYKYRDWKKSYHRDILTKQELYFSSSSEFEDPFDCRFPVEIDFSYEALFRFVANLKQFERRGPINLSQVQAEADYLYKRDFNTIEKRQLKEKEFYKLFNNSLGIFCFAKRNNSPEMWEKYADHRQGFCVGVSLNSHYRYLAEKGVGGADVTYVDEDHPRLKWVSTFQSKVGAMKFFFKMTMLKYRKWEFEDEYRLIKEHYLPYSIQPKLQDKKIPIPKSSYQEIIFGDKMPDSERRDIIEVCKNENLDVKFYTLQHDEAKHIVIANF